MLKYGFVLLSLLSLPIQLSAQTKPAAGTATVSGRVVLNGEPVRGVTVALTSPQFGPRGNAESVPRAKTDETGRFRITGVAKGQYSVMAMAPGYVSPNSDDFGRGATPLTVADGETIENVEIELKRGGVITGRVTDAQGRPLVDERITLFKLEGNGKPQSFYPSGMYSGSMEMQTDDRGVYRVYGLQEGRYLVSIGHSQRDGSISIQTNRVFYPRTYHPDASEESQAKPIDVTAGSESTGVDIAAAEPKKTYDVFGRVVNADTGQPVAGVELSYGTIRNDGRGMSGWGSKGERSGANGEFQLAGVLPGKYGVFARTEAGGEFVSDPTVCEVGDSDIHGIEVRVRQGATISGVVVIESTTDPAVLARLKQIQIYAYSRMNQQTQLSAPAQANAKVNADGTFLIRGVASGKIHLAIQGSSDLNRMMQLRVEHNGTPAPEGIQVAAAEQVTNVRFVLGYGTGVVRGQLKVVGGELPADISLLVYARRIDGSASGGQTSQSGQVDARGQFLIEHLPPGEYELRVSAFNRTRTNNPANQFPANQFWQAIGRIQERVVASNGSETQAAITIDLTQKEKNQ